MLEKLAEYHKILQKKNLINYPNDFFFRPHQ